MKKLNVFLVCSFVLSALSSCSIKHDGNAVETISLNGKEVILDEDFAGIYHPKSFADGIISEVYLPTHCGFIGKFMGDSLLSEGYVFPKGDGPYEFADVMLYCEGDSAITVFNSNGGHPLTIDRIKTASVFSKEHSGWERYPLERMGGFRGGNVSFVSLSDSTLLLNSGNFETGGIFSILNYKSGELKELDWRPEDGFKGNPMVRQGAYVDNSYLYRNGDNIFYLCGNGQYGFIFTISGESLNITSPILSVYPDYSEFEDGINYVQKLNGSSYTASANDEAIYLLEKDLDMKRMKTEDDRTPRVFGNIVHVYDWEGKHIRDYSLEGEYVSIMVTSDNRTLYAITVDGETLDDRMMRFNLPL